MTRLLLPATLAVALGLAGCAHDPSDAQQAAADYGNKPSARDAAALIRAHLAQLPPGTSYHLKAPTSIVPAWSRDQLTVISYGYLAYYTISLRNATGSYGPWQRRALFIRDGWPLKTLVVRDDGSLVPE